MAHQYAQQGNLDMLKEHLRNNPDDLNALDKYQDTPLVKAVYYIKDEVSLYQVVTFLVSKMEKANLDVKDENHFTALHKAVKRKLFDIVNCLVSGGADVNVQTDKGWTPLHEAAYGGQLNIVTLLVDEGANVNAQNHNYWTPLHQAAAKGHYEVVTFLVSRGADMTVKHLGTETAIDCAQKNGFHTISRHSDIVNFLENYLTREI